jgi:hypothetical protein
MEDAMFRNAVYAAEVLKIYDDKKWLPFLSAFRTPYHRYLSAVGGN